MILQKLEKLKIISPPGWLLANTHFLARVGSQAYGVSNDDSDLDLYGWAIPKREDIFPHLVGYVGLGSPPNRFEQYLEHGKEYDGIIYDIQIYNVVKYFNLLLNANPSVIDTLFVPRECIAHITQIGELVREKRKIFLTKKCFHTYKGYAFAQSTKMNSIERTGKRKEIYEKFGWDVKFGYHLKRLIYECEQILEEGDIDLRRNSEELKAIRRGEVSKEDLLEWFADKEKYLEKLYETSKIPHKADFNEINELLVSILEHHYGSLSKVISNPNKFEKAFQDIKKICENI